MDEKCPGKSPRPEQAKDRCRVKAGSFGAEWCHRSLATPSAGKHGVACAEHSPDRGEVVGRRRSNRLSKTSLAFLTPHPKLPSLCKSPYRSNYESFARSPDKTNPHTYGYWSSIPFTPFILVRPFLSSRENFQFPGSYRKGIHARPIGLWSSATGFS